MAVAGGVCWTVKVTLKLDGTLEAVREQAQSVACFDGSMEQIEGRLVAGRTVRLTERRYNEYLKWQEEE